MTSLSQPKTPPLYTPRAKNLALVLLAMTQFVIVIDASIVNVALPSIGAALHYAPADLSWVVNAYVLTFGGFLLLGGRVADLLGRRRTWCGSSGMSRPRTGSSSSTRRG
jgi:MFS family permease